MTYEPDIRFYRNYEFVEHEKGLPIRILYHIAPELQIQLHWHEDMEFLFVIEGTCEVFVEGSINNLSKGDFVLISPHQFHKLVKNNGSIFIALQIDPEYIEKVVPEISLRSYHCAYCKDHTINLEKSLEIQDLIARFISEHIKEEYGYKLYLMTVLNLLLYKIIKNFPYMIKKKHKNDNQNNIVYQNRLKRILDYIKENYQERITLQELSEQFSLHPNYLSRYFSEYLGISFKKYLDYYRLQKSMQILTKEKITIGEVAMTSGFADIRSYNSLFKKQFGINPSEWRKKFQQQEIPELPELDESDIFTQIQKSVIKFVKKELNIL